METLAKMPNFAIDYPANVRSIAAAQLVAVAEGDAERAGELTARLAEAVLALPIVAAAPAVHEGGPLAVARAVQLAELVLEREEVTGARSMPTASMA
jgi:hypothetical protein